MMHYSQKFGPRRYGPRQLLIFDSLAAKPLKYAELVSIHEQRRSNITTHTQKLESMGLISITVIANPNPKPGQGLTCNQYALTAKGWEVVQEFRKTSSDSDVTQIAITRT